MKKFLLLGIPVLVSIFTLVSFVVHYFDGNSAAMWANLTAFMGWLTISLSSYLDFKIEQYS